VFYDRKDLSEWGISRWMNSQRISGRNKVKVDYKMLNEEGVKMPVEKEPRIEDIDLGVKPKKSKANSEKVLSSTSTDKPDEVKVIKSPSSSKITGKLENLERKAMLARLADLDEQQRCLEEQRELKILRKQVLEREAFVTALEKSLSTEADSLSSPIVKSHVISADPIVKPVSVGSSLEPLTATSVFKGKQNEKTGKKTRMAAAFDSPTNHKGMTMNIDSLRKMTDLQKKTKKTLAQLGLVDMTESDSSTESDDNSSYSFSSTDAEEFNIDSRKKKSKNNRKHGSKSGITSKSSDMVKNRQRFPHSNLRFDFASRNVTFENLEFNLFIAGELEIIMSSITGKSEKEGRLDLLKKLMYLNSSYDYAAIKAVYAAILREIELGHCNWSDDFQYVESAV
jgi:hypothetical protein